jgi:hypothetical protein
MPAFLSAALLSITLPSTDTVVTLGIVERDLTGDGIAEVLRLTGTGATIDSLDVTFTISSSGSTLYVDMWSITRTVGFCRGRRVLSDAQHRARLRDFGGWFFEESKFMTPDQFLEKLRVQGRRHIAEIPNVMARNRRYQEVVDSLIAAGLDARQARDKARFGFELYGSVSRAAAAWDAIRAAPVTVFQYSVGGDNVTAIVWSPTERRFYDIWDCC